MLGFVFAWFGFHELWQPHLWTGYVPFLSPTSSLAVAAVLIHGWVLLLLATALLFGIVPRLAAALGVLVMIEVVLSLTLSGGLNDIATRDIGVLGLALAVLAQPGRDLLLTR